jgi:hypothetical protein
MRHNLIVSFRVSNNKFQVFKQRGLKKNINHTKLPQMSLAHVNYSLMQTSMSSSPTNISYTRINIAQEATRRNKQNTSHRINKIK